MVAPKRFATTRSDEATFQGGFVEKDVRVVGHKCLPDTTFALVGKHKQAESHYESITYDKKQFVPRNVDEVQFT